MATTTVKTQTPALLTASAAGYYTVATGAVGNIKELLFCNTTATDRNVTVYYVPSGQTAGAAYTIMSATTIAAGTTVRIPMNSFLAAGAQVQALANVATAIMFLVSAVEYS